MNKSVKVFIIGLVVIVLVGIIGIIAVMEMFKPNDEVENLNNYFGVTNDKEAVLVLQNEIYDKKASYENGEVYVDLSLVNERFNKRFYWDKNEKVLIYTFPEQMMVIKPDSKTYSIDGKDKDYDKVIVKIDDDVVKVALSFVQKYSDIECSYYNDPMRVVVRYIWDEEETTYSIEQDTQLRTDASSKSKILKELQAADKVVYLSEDNTKISKGYIKVITDDGIVGYVKESTLGKLQSEKPQSKFEAPVYTNISKDYDINLTWNVISNATANGFIKKYLDSVEGVTTISPTWFSLADTSGNINSLASEDYVKEVHNKGMEVWALVDDFSTDVKVSDVLGTTSSRQKLISNLMKEIKKYNIDGINVDFEKIKSDFAADYIEFIRELSIECRKNKIVLSIDSYVPMSYSSYYDRKEQGIVADYVIIMAYDEHYAGSEESGSVSSISWVESAVNNTLEQVSDSKKVIIGIPFYTRIWEEEMNTDGTSTLIASKAYGMEEAKQILMDNGALINWDNDTMQNYAEYSKNGHLFRTWIEDTKSIDAKLQVICDTDVAGVASWRLGFESKDVWKTIKSHLNK